MNGASTETIPSWDDSLIFSYSLQRFSARYSARRQASDC